MYEPGLTIKEAEEKHIEDLVNMTVRFYRFNEEFDPAYSTKPEIDGLARAYIQESFEKEDVLLLVACWNDKPVGFARTEIRRNMLIKNEKYGTLIELYVKPRYRRQGVASKLIQETKKKLAEKGVYHIAAQFPAMNVIAERFYKKNGFRPWTQIFIQEVG
ncbi:MAG: GNAT family N-acetyltransferase [Desulfurococcales archaeon]|nr:GNAT family N-acetyltransferase [Desulfurococcales archaeon]